MTGAKLTSGRDVHHNQIDGVLEAVYRRRLELLRPSREHMRRLGKLYRERLVRGADRVVAALMALGRQVFIISGGLAEAVQDLGNFLGFPPSNIYAVEMEYNQLAGRWWERWTHPGGRNPDEGYLAHAEGPLTVGQGKAAIIRAVRQAQRGRAFLVGDGLSDLEAAEAVDLFVGFGGVIARPRVMAGAEVVIHAPDLAPLLPLALARPAVPPAYQAAYAEGIRLIREGHVTFRDPHARQGLLQRMRRD